MNIVEYAEHTGRTKQLISRWLKPRGLLEHVHIRENGKINIDAEAADKIIATQLNQAQSRRESFIKKQFPPDKQNKQENIQDGKTQVYTFQDALIKDKYYSAALKKMKIDRENKTLVLKADMDKEAFECARQIRDAMLNIPSRISSILTATVNEAIMNNAKIDEVKVDNILTKEITQALETYSESG